MVFAFIMLQKKRELRLERFLIGKNIKIEDFLFFLIEIKDLNYNLRRSLLGLFTIIKRQEDLTVAKRGKIEEILNGKLLEEEALDSIDTLNIKKLICEYLKIQINELLKIDQRCLDMYILLCLIELHEFKCFWKGYFILKKGQNICKISAQKWIILSFLYKEIEEKLKNDEEHVSKMSSFDLKHTINYRVSYLDLLAEVKKNLFNYTNFWTELYNNSINTRNLNHIYEKINKKNEIIENKFKNMTVKFEDNFHFRLMYITYLREIVNDEKSSSGETDNLDYWISSNFDYNERIKKGNIYLMKESAFFFVSGEEDSRGTILSVCNQVEGIVGYTSSELKNENIDLLMPPFFSKIHGRIFNNFFTKDYGKTIQEDRIVFAKKKGGFISPCKLRLKVLIDLSDSLKIVGILKRVEIEDLDIEEDSSDSVSLNRMELNCILYEEESLRVIGVSRGCYDNFGVDSGIFMVNGKNDLVRINQFFPCIEEIKKKSKGKIVDLDFDSTFLLEDRYQIHINNNKNEEKNKPRLLEENSEVDDSEYGEFSFQAKSDDFLKKELKVKKTTVNACLTFSKQYEGVTINCIHFYENSELKVRKVEKNLHSMKEESLEEKSQMIMGNVRFIFF